jgi:HEPN domain-containing protein
VTRRELQDLSRRRLREAKVLLRARCYDGAYYLAGYAVECALKACIAKQVSRHDFPDRKLALDSYTHDLVKLVDVAKLKTDLEAELGQDPPFALYWEVVSNWSEQSRYARASSQEANLLITAIEDSTHGVIQWLQRYW